MPEARQSVQRVADHLAERFSMHHQWDGDTLQFSGNGVEGDIRVTAKSVQVSATLGFLLMAFKGSVEREINRFLDEEFS